jgi:two-component system, NtrC family, response regulator HydG
MTQARILVVDDDATFRMTTGALLEADGYTVETAGDGQQAVERMKQQRFDLMLVDLRMPGIDGIALVEALRLWGHGVPILMISGFGTVESAVRALQTGADDFLLKPVEPDVLSARVSDLLERRPQETHSAPNPGGLVGRSAPMRALIDRMQRVAVTETTVLITGETGTGKELVARGVHALSPRAKKPFLAVNCSALAEGLLESELFGHVRGAFTSAARDRAGVFEAADGGTLFLDEIGTTTPALQSRLLRALQEKEITRVGSTTVIRVDVRIVAATNLELKALVAEGKFREDLYYRLAVYPLNVPPLRERATDIPLLVEHGLTQLRGRIPGAATLSCSPLAMRLLRQYAWPGNVRQLMAALESAAISAGDSGRIEAQHLPDEIREPHDTSSGRYKASAPPDDERAAIEGALAHTGGVLSRAADLLGMGRTTLWRKMRVYGISQPVDAEPSEAPTDD